MYHCSELYYLGFPPEDIIELLEFPLVSLAEIEKQARIIEVNSWPQADSNEETFLLMCCLRMIEGQDRKKIMMLLKEKLIPSDFDQLVLFLSFSAAYVDWCESVNDDEKIFGQKIHDRIANLIDREPRLEKYFSGTEVRKKEKKTEHEIHWHKSLFSLPCALALFEYPSLQKVYENE